VVLCSVGNRVKIIDAFTKMKETSYILFPSYAFRRKKQNNLAGILYYSGRRR